MGQRRDSSVGHAEVEQVFDTFLGLPQSACRYEDSRVVLLRAPYDGSTSYVAGARGGPAAILDASTQVELYDRELARSPSEVGIHTAGAILPAAAAGPEAVMAQVELLARDVVGDDKFPFLLGGEHSLTLGAARAVAEAHPGVSFLQIDAHLDLRASYEGSRYSHACVAYNLLDLLSRLRGDADAPDAPDAPDASDASDSDAGGGGTLVHVGVRTACPEELAIVEAEGLAPIWGEDCAAEDDERWIARAIAGLGETVYVTVDVDGLDPSVIPGTGTPVPGGLTWYQVLHLLRAVGERRRVVGCDLMELAPGLGDHRSAYAAALLVYKMIGYFTAS
ncbi:MAG: agmatinase family protein [Deltaproteobacteria bacterium]|nr:agmatinase family protein [Deltaproteobacteria bacterium]